MKLDINKWQSTTSFPSIDIQKLHDQIWSNQAKESIWTGVRYGEISLFYIHPSGKTLRFSTGAYTEASMGKASILQQSMDGVIIFNTSKQTTYKMDQMIETYQTNYFSDKLKDKLNIRNRYKVEKMDDYGFDVKDFNKWLNDKYQINDSDNFYLNKSDDKHQISDWIRARIKDYYKDQHNIDIYKRCVIIEPDRMIVSDSDFVFERYGLYLQTAFNNNPPKSNKLGSSNLILNIPEKPGNSIKSLSHSLYEELSQLDNTLLDTSSIKVPEQRKHHELYESQEWALEQLQKHGSGFQMLAGEAGVGKIHIASSYINDYLKDKPNANILIVEPVKEVIPKFEQLIDNLDNITITDDVEQLNQEQWDVVLFDEMHKQNNKTVKDFPRKTKHYPDVVIGITGTVSDMKLQEVYQITKNYEIKNIELHGGSLQTHLSSQSYLRESPKTYHYQLMQYQQLPEAYVNNILKPVDLLRSDVKELNLESRMPVNNYQASFEMK